MEVVFMNCNVCGAEIPAGAAACPVCGAPAPAGGPAPQPGYDAMQGGYADPNQQYGVDPYAQNAAAVNQQKSVNKGLIIGIGVAVAVVVALLVMWMLGVFGGDHDGTYKLSGASAFGMELSGDQLKEYGMDPDKYLIKISGSTATLDMGGTDSKCKVSFSGSKVTFKDNYEEIEGTYKNGEITINYMGVEMKFAK